MQDIFHLARNKLLSDFPCPIVHSRLHTIENRFVRASEMAKSLTGDNYQRYTNIPAYFDPNTNHVYLNSTYLKKLDDITVFVICYHELIHGASLHANYRLPDFNVFQSGVKFERYGHDNYNCFNRLLNEGMVQFFTTHNNDIMAENYAYREEVALVEQIVEDLGQDVVKNALLYEQYTQFKLRFEDFYGVNSFNQFTAFLDKKQYASAAEVLAQKNSNPTYYINFSPAAAYV